MYFFREEESETRFKGDFSMKLATTLTILAIAFIVTVILAPISIPLLRRLKFGQSIREEGPKSHMKKQVHQRWEALSFNRHHPYNSWHWKLFRFIHLTNRGPFTCARRLWLDWLFR